MALQRFDVTGATPDPASIAAAARIVRDGGLVAFPTETVYGLAADATNPEAIERLNRVKGRPAGKPYTLHLHATSQARELVPAIPSVAQQLMARFWPGPLTLVLPYDDTKTVGLRVPDHPVAHAFLKACGVPVAAPSANRSGDRPPTSAEEVLRALGEAFDGLLDGGSTSVGRESTVVQITNGSLTITREGAIARDAVLSVADASGQR